jgi:hypothetical protein
MASTKYVNDMDPVIIYDSDEEMSDVSTSQKSEIKYSQINTTETQDDNMRF